MDNMLDLLLQMELPSPPTTRVKIKRLSKLLGKDVMFDLRALTFNRVAEIKSMGDDSDINVQILLSGVVSPNLRDSKLLAKYKAETPAELVKQLLLAGEVEDIARKVERLSGYRDTTIEEVKKK